MTPSGSQDLRARKLQKRPLPESGSGQNELQKRGRQGFPGGAKWTPLKSWVPQHLLARLWGLHVLLHLIPALQEAGFLELAVTHTRGRAWGSWRGEARAWPDWFLHGDLLEGGMLRKGPVCVLVRQSECCMSPGASQGEGHASPSCALSILDLRPVTASVWV